MPTIANCPSCERQVSLPQGASADVRVQCPLCGEAYLLEEALKTAPPELVLLDAPRPASTAVTKADRGAMETWSPDEMDADDFEVEPPQDGPIETDAFDFGGEFEEDRVINAGANPAGAAADLPKMAPLPARRKSSSNGSMFRQLIGVFGGGAVGLALGYIVLLWIGGPPKDFLKVGAKLPAFMVPAAFHPHDDGADAANDLREGNAEQAKLTGPESEPNPPPSPEPNPSDSFENPPPPGDPLAANTPPANEPTEPPADQPSVEVKPSVIGAPKFTPAELGAALKEAANAKQPLLEGSLNEEEYKTRIVDAYQTFCTLAEVATFVEGNSGEDQFDSRREAVHDLMLEVAADVESGPDIGRLCIGWLKAGKGNGVLVVGEVKSVSVVGKIPVSQVVLFGQREITLVHSQLPSWQVGDRAIVLGSIVNDPANNIVGYEGDEMQVVWAGMTATAEN